MQPIFDRDAATHVAGAVLAFTNFVALEGAEGDARQSSTSGGGYPNDKNRIGVQETILRGTMGSDP